MPIQSKQQPPYYTSEQNVKTLIAILTQSSTNPPTITIIKNTYKGKITTAYSSPGSYTIESTLDEFLENKTLITMQNILDESGDYAIASRENDESVRIKTLEAQGDGTYALADGYLDTTWIQITTLP